MSKLLLCITLALALFTSQANGLYFYLSKGMRKCFKDDVIKYSVIDLAPLILFRKLRPSSNFWIRKH